ncbi:MULTISPECIES: FAD-binding oxidoreductase [Actinomadura]|uniref:FAD-dependent oxidoreductase n=1 Tax=Actinomadura litoris TaxID=2678616 RepID=A0A7K1KT03_9ACTN|nr:MULTISPECIES: FAD-dependent oxidoreductase [Actinomadura]MBT2207823.1 FAD-binding oxidoreductase [Actinomadura sp. NEAU-AAG7]MUN35321.1 FAD-dependent oxidoreductase [Actinomadura litoris]
MKAVVVGAGIMGAAVAHQLARAGASVQIVEAGRPSRGATGVTFSRLSAFDKEPHDYFRLNGAGMEEHARLAAETPLSNWYHPCGTVLLSDDEQELRRRAERYRAWGYPLAWRSETRLGPVARLPARVLHAPTEGWVNAVTLTRHLLELATRHGAVVRPETPVIGLARGAASWTVTTAGGRVLSADVVVNAAGQGAPAIAAGAGTSLALTRGPGLLLTVAIPGETLRHIVHSPEVSIRPDGPGRVLIRSGPVDRRLEDGSDLRELTQDLLARAARVLPHLAYAAVVRPRIGQRVLPEGGLPSIGAVPELPGYHEAVSHSGVVLAPLVGRLLAEEIITGRRYPGLEPFRPRPAPAG